MDPSDPPLTEHRHTPYSRNLGVVSVRSYHNHTGGFYIPGTLSSEARRLAYAVLQSRQFGIYHSDMQMSRFIIQIIPKEKEDNPQDPDPNVILTLLQAGNTLTDRPLSGPGTVSHSSLPLVHPTRTAHMGNGRRISETFNIYLMNDRRMLPLSKPVDNWVRVGVPERWFEGCLGGVIGCTRDMRLRRG